MIKLIILFSGIYIHSNAQLIIDPTIIKKYNEEYLKISPKYRKNIEDASKDTLFKDFASCLSFFTHYQTDTLNKQDFKRSKLNSIHIEDIPVDSIGKVLPVIKSSANTIDPSEEENVLYLPILFCAGTIYNDTLMIELGMWDGFFTKVINNKVYSSNYKTDYFKGDSVFSLTLKSKKFPQLTVRTSIVSFILNTSHYKIGDTLYGEAELQTDPFYFYEASVSNSGFIKKRLRIKYLFKLQLLDPPPNMHF